MVGVNFDVTERRQTEQHYRLIDRALDSATNGIAIADAQAPDLPLIYVNEGFELLTGFGRDEALGRNGRRLCLAKAGTARLREIAEGEHRDRMTAGTNFLVDLEAPLQLPLIIGAEGPGERPRVSRRRNLLCGRRRQNQHGGGASEGEGEYRAFDD